PRPSPSGGPHRRGAAHRRLGVRPGRGGRRDALAQGARPRLPRRAGGSGPDRPDRRDLRLRPGAGSEGGPLAGCRRCLPRLRRRGDGDSRRIGGRRHRGDGRQGARSARRDERGRRDLGGPRGRRGGGRARAQHRPGAGGHAAPGGSARRARGAGGGRAGGAPRARDARRPGTRGRQGVMNDRLERDIGDVARKWVPDTRLGVFEVAVQRGALAGCTTSRDALAALPPIAAGVRSLGADLRCQGERFRLAVGARAAPQRGGQVETADGRVWDVAAGALRPEVELRVEARLMAAPEWALRWFSGAPYAWGGRTEWGVDCSGLVQATYAARGVALPRDSDLQSAAGREVPLEATGGGYQAGDVLCFADGRRISHVA